MVGKQKEEISRKCFPSMWWKSFYSLINIYAFSLWWCARHPQLHPSKAHKVKHSNIEESAIVRTWHDQLNLLQFQIKLFLTLTHKNIIKNFDLFNLPHSNQMTFIFNANKKKIAFHLIPPQARLFHWKSLNDFHSLLFLPSLAELASAKKQIRADFALFYSIPSNSLQTPRISHFFSNKYKFLFVLGCWFLVLYFPMLVSKKKRRK